MPHGDDLHALLPMLPKFVAYVLSFIYVGIYWNKHHHLLGACRNTSGSVLWANLNLLFWLSLFPVTTDWIGEHPSAAWPTAVYGCVLLLAAISYFLLQQRIIAADGHGSHLKRALGSDWKGKLSPIIYLCGIGLAFVAPHIAQCMFGVVALLWLIPDRRIERGVPAE